MVHYKLVYFNLRGRAELARLIFAAAGQEYEDHRIERVDWPQFKPTTPFGQVPYLEVNDAGNVLQLAQSIAIARYLARKFNLVGQNENEQAEVDMYADLITDLANEMAKVFKEKDETRKAELSAQLFNQIIPDTWKFLEEKLAKSNSGYLLPSGLTWIDLYLVCVNEWLGDKKTAILQNFSLVKAHDDRVKALPRIVEWLQKRPVTEL